MISALRIAQIDILLTPHRHGARHMSLIFSWTNPANRADGTTPSDPSNTVAIAIAPAQNPLPTDLSTLSFVPVGVSAPGASSLSVATNPAPGDYIAQAIVTDSQTPAKSGAAFYSSVFTVPAVVTNPLPAPGSVSGLSVTVTP